VEDDAELETVVAKLRQIRACDCREPAEGEEAVSPALGIWPESSTDPAVASRKSKYAGRNSAKRLDARDRKSLLEIASVWATQDDRYALIVALSRDFAAQKTRADAEVRRNNEDQIRTLPARATLQV